MVETRGDESDSVLTVDLHREWFALEQNGRLSLAVLGLLVDGDAKLAKLIEATRIHASLLREEKAMGLATCRHHDFTIGKE